MATANVAQKPQAQVEVNDPINPKRGTTGSEEFPSVQAALDLATKRKKGARRVFVCTAPDGKQTILLSHNQYHAGAVAFGKIGGKVEEHGKPARAVKPVTPDAFMAALATMPENEKQAVLAQLKSLMGASGHQKK